MEQSAGKFYGIPTSAFLCAALIVLCIWYLVENGFVSIGSESQPMLQEIMPSNQNGLYYVVASTNIRNRSTAQGSRILGRASRGERLTGTVSAGERSSALWLRLNNGRGFVSEVNLSKSVPPKLSVTYNDMKIRTSSTFNLLKAPDNSSQTIKIIQARSDVIVAGITENGFIEVKRREGGVGYVAREKIDQPEVGTTTRPPLLFGDYTGFFMDQNITISMKGGVPRPLVQLNATASYSNTVTGARCVSKLEPIPASAGGRTSNKVVRFYQKPVVGEPSCPQAISVKIDISGQRKNRRGIIGGMSVEWLAPSGGRVLMQGQLTKRGQK